jgi:GMP synthase-like glutamine amidotransferase
LRLLVIQHAACEPPGAYEDELLARGIGFERVLADAGEPLPAACSFDAIVAMGGPMSVNDEDELPWLAAEKALIADAVRGGLPYWGVCLGAQLLASSLGARVTRGDGAEIGVYDDVQLTDAAIRDPVFAGAPSRITTLQWHGDTFDLPDGATLLASSRAYQHQAFVWRRAYGLQFHLEASSELARTWLDVPAYVEELADALGVGGLEAFAQDVRALDETTPLARELFGRWIDRVVGAPT